jgi:hypothetical protein
MVDTAWYGTILAVSRHVRLNGELAALRVVKGRVCHIHAAGAGEGIVGHARKRHLTTSAVRWQRSG